MTSRDGDGKPKELALLEIRRRVLFPGMLLRLQIGRPKSVRLAESIWDTGSRSFQKGALIGICTVEQEDEKKEAISNETTRRPVETFEIGDLNVYKTGTVARVLQLSRVNGSDNQAFQFSLLVEGVARIEVEKLIRSDPFNVGKVKWLESKSSSNDTQVQALSMNVRDMARGLLELQRKRSSPNAKKIKEVIDNIDDASPSRLADLLASNLDASVEEKQGVLCEVDLVSRLRLTLELMNRQVEVFKISDKIQSEVEGKLKNTQREYYLRQQLRAINDELGSMNGKGGANDMDEIELLEQALDKANLPSEARASADRELQRLRQMQPSQPEHSVLRTYLELLSELPWSVSTKDNLDVENARSVLDADHHALNKVKKRIIEFLAVRSLKPDMKGPILCLVGPPGVGKTSLGKSIAEALGRNFRRIALGGVRDEAEIRGHRRTYIGALPGTIISSLKKAGSNNPVILFDEVDKLGRDVRGDPASALLEVLDPEQNDTFVDHYMNVPFDLSKVMFIATANRLDTIPGPLLDRMEIIELPGYTLAEKHEIATRHLVPKQMSRHGITKQHVEFSPNALELVIASYTREAGVRNLDREIAALCRFAAVKVAEARDLHDHDMGRSDIQEIVEDEAISHHVSSEGVEEGKKGKEEELVLHESFKQLVITPQIVEAVLGQPKYESEVAQRTAVPGVSTGMAWTQVGGEILFIEAWLHRGAGRLQLTGQLGSVMQESVRAALSFIRGNLVELGLDKLQNGSVDLQQAVSKADLHVHFPAGAVQKDGPSAGVAVTAAILSAISGRCVRPDTACTGEITLRGLVLPVGGIKEKVLAAHRAGIKRIVLPRRNTKDIKDIPEDVLKDLEVIFVSDIVQAMTHLFDMNQKAMVPRWLKEIEDSEKSGKKSSSANPMEPTDLSPSTNVQISNNGMSARDISGVVDLMSNL